MNFTGYAIPIRTRAIFSPNSNWVVGYHGTSISAAYSIMKQGLK